MFRFKAGTWALIGLIGLLGILPIGAYWVAIGRAPTITASQALAMLNQPGTPGVLIDARPVGDFAGRHVDGALNWPLTDIVTVKAADQIPAQFQGKTLILISNGGWIGPQAVFHLQSLGVQSVYNVRGGLQEWSKAGWKLSTLAFSHFVGQGRSAFLVFQSMSPLEENALTLAGGVIKPLYMLISLILMIWLFGRATPDIAGLGWGMLFFFAGEFLCLVNSTVFVRDSYLLEYLHAFGMAVCFGFVIYVLLENFDRRVFQLALPGKRCAAIVFCQTCPGVQQATKCRARSLSRLFIPVLAIVATMPLLAPIEWGGYTALGNGWSRYFVRLGFMQIYEIRFLPVLAIVFFGLAYLPLWFSAREPLPTFTKVFLSAGLGILSFSGLRLGLGTMYASTLAWSSFWEETTELIFVAAMGVMLWKFRPAFFRSRVMSAASATPAAVSGSLSPSQGQETP